METIIKRIHAQRNALSDCGRDIFTGTETIEELAALFRSPQGQEFCHKFGFPNLKTWRELNREYDLTRFGVYVDAGRISLINDGYVTLVGATTGECLRYDEMKRHEVMLMHGAQANIVAEKWAVVIVHSDRSSSFTKQQKDFSKIFCDRGL